MGLREIVLSVLVLMQIGDAHAFGLQSTQLAKRNLTAEEVSIYRAFLRWFVKNGPIANDNSNKDFVLDKKRSRLIASEMAQDDCLRGLKLESRSGNSNDLTEKDLVKLGWNHSRDSSRTLKVSNVVYADKRTRAVITFVAYCGNVCLLATTVVLRKTGSSWVVEDRGCSETVSYRLQRFSPEIWRNNAYLEDHVAG